MNFDEAFNTDGVVDLFSPNGFRLAWTEYQGFILAKLNALLAGTGDENTSIHGIATKYARDPMSASIFNHASMAFNNEKFFSTFSTFPTPLDAPSVTQLRRLLEQDFGSIDTLRATMLDTAAAMFGPGFVWLVHTEAGFKILTTYLAGSPYPEAGYRRQGIDVNTTGREDYKEYIDGVPTNNAGAFGKYSTAGREAAGMPPGATKVTPVLCVNTWEHVWLYDYGIKGKSKYLAEWWEAVDWARVDSTNVPREAYGFDGKLARRGAR